METPEAESWMKNLPISRKVSLGVILLLVTFVSAGVATLYTFDRINVFRAESAQTSETVEKIHRTSRLLRDRDVAAKNYLLFPHGDRRARYDSFDGVIDAALDDLEPAVSGNPEQLQVIRDLRRLLLDWNKVAAPLIESVPADHDAYVEFISEFSKVNFSGLGDRTDQMISRLEYALDIEILQRTEAFRQVNALQEVVRMIVLGSLVAAILIAILMGWLTDRMISQPIRGLAQRMTRLAEGDHEIDIPGLGRGDEVGAMSKALGVFRSQSIEAARGAWIKTHLSEIGVALPRGNSPEAMAELLLSELAERLGVRVGVFYVLDESQEPLLQLFASWGLVRRKHLGNTYRLGEGLVGQCARERKPITLEQVPHDYIRIQSGTGDAAPGSIVVLPLVTDDRLLGVLELGFPGRVDDASQTVLEELTPRVALMLDRLTKSKQMEELLRQTQLQAMRLEASEEELRGQQEALFSANEDLQAKTVELEEQSQRLQASEEELRVQAEELQASNEELRLKTDTLNEQKRMLEELQVETQRRAEELARASQYKSDFLANMSHELRTPLNSLLILSKSLTDNEAGHLDEEEVESARIIHQSGGNLLRLINDILDLSKIEAGKMELSFEEIYVHELVAAMRVNFRPVANEKDLEFIVEVEDDLPETWQSDPVRVEQITNNLLSNAFKFTHQGHVKLRVERPDAALAARAGLAGVEALAFRIIDTGIGIESQTMQRIFEPFEQADASTSRHYGGSGLGLSIARRLAQMLGGALVADSEAGKGSDFALVLPLKQRDGEQATRIVSIEPPQERPQPQAPRPAPRAAAAPPPKRHGVVDDREAIGVGEVAILVIEDDERFAKILVDMIRRKGYRALAADSGEYGLELARQYSPTGIILDVGLPGMDGWEVIEALKADPTTRGIPVHFISGQDESGRGEELGAVGFLTKPVDRNAVFTALDRLLAHAQHRERHVLIIDADEASRQSLAGLVRSDQVSISEAGNAEEALSRLKEGRPDCIVLDMNLPGASALELLEQAAQAGPLPPVVICSDRELRADETLRLRQYTDSIVIKGGRSDERLLDEISLFMHSIRPAGSTPGRQTDPELTGRTVLVVDDDMRNVFALSKTLRDRGMNVMMAQDGEKALRQLRDNPGIELVLMDIMMPGMDGYETTRAIRAQPRYSKLPIIAVTAKAMPDDRDKCLKAGASDYLAKPIDVDKLVSMIRVWLQS
jgi:CheY-like chemotaxis protein/CHASE3 domain sensor protein/putative methionine-R-sulfoxide reductase with GAF domain